MVEIARALSMDAKLVVMDEPTSALSDKEVQRLFAIVRGLKASGISVVFVTHRLEEVMRICDRVTVLRDGALAGEAAVGDLDIDAHHPPDGRPRGRAAVRAPRPIPAPARWRSPSRASPAAATRATRTR